MHPDYFISTNQAELDISLIHSVLTKSYWAKGIPRATVEQSIENSLCFAVYNYQKQQVGFARVISDYSTFAYLADIFVLEEHQGKGLAKALMHRIMAHPKLQGIRRFKLATQDAHGLYQQFGFTELVHPEIHMERWQPNFYLLPQS
ncbi:GNAT family N-acetyltransferase [Agarivorans aestuarii]|uniref:GNAT family N-acetyltransferase n=1 Tax=Agarivorans aestuarii TaxID=1563703 RepID=A0ABU7G5K5_9ALTE|nr:GNAT family N-acetyltransferase [Agarivorans aestuarii]MEE1674570.1 GNAT family N-acetyltransferase [Agarivorans aestuarii]